MNADKAVVDKWSALAHYYWLRQNWVKTIQLITPGHALIV